MELFVTKTMNERWLSNTWLVADRPGGTAILVDTGGPMGEIRATIEELRLELTHALCTHHHVDHVLHNAEYRREYGCAVCGHALESDLFDGLDVELVGDDELVSGDLHVRALHIPGHTRGQLGFLVNDTHVFTGDTLFRGSVGGTRAPGHTTFADLQHSVMETLMRLDKSTVVHPGHTEPTTIAREWEENPFVRLWRGLDAPESRPCIALGQPATLLLEAVDYDGGKKCLVRFDGADEPEVVPGSRVRLTT